MKHTNLVRIYGWLLRLYPPDFRAEYADEMREVFAAAASDVADRWSLVSLCAGELRDLPLRLLQEHLQARRQRVLVTNTGVMMTESRWPAQLLRALSISLFIVCALFMLMVVLPFFALGLHTQTSMEVISGSFGPEAFPLYSSGLLNPNPLPRLGPLVLLAAPVWGVVFGVSTLFLLLWLWGRLSPQWRVMGLVAVLVGIAPLIFLLLPVGSNTSLWWFN
jgi:hypothetical protein